VSLQPCTNCGRVKRPKITTVYVSWSAENARVSKRQLLCRGCAEEYSEYVKSLKPLPDDEADGEWPETCSGCGGRLAEDFSPTYMTVFEPKQEAVKLVIAHCEACALNARPTLTANALPTADRLARDVGAPTPPTEVQRPKALAWA
jgi:hypothetical protein